MAFREPPPPPPSMNDILTAVAALRPPVPAEEKGLAKFAPPVIVALVIGLLGWVGATLSSVSTSVATMSANLATVQKSVEDLNTKQSGQSDKIADLQSRIAQHDLRLNAIDTLDQRMNDRLRIVEGQKPLSKGEPGL